MMSFHNCFQQHWHLNRFQPTVQSPFCVLLSQQNFSRNWFILSKSKTQNVYLRWWLCEVMFGQLNPFDLPVKWFAIKNFNLDNFRLTGFFKKLEILYLHQDVLTSAPRFINSSANSVMTKVFFPLDFYRIQSMTFCCGPFISN